MENVLSDLKRQIDCIQINLYLFMSDLRMELSTQLNTNKLYSNKHLFIIVEASVWATCIHVSTLQRVPLFSVLLWDKKVEKLFITTEE